VRGGRFERLARWKSVNLQAMRGLPRRKLYFYFYLLTYHVSVLLTILTCDAVSVPQTFQISYLPPRRLREPLTSQQTSKTSRTSQTLRTSQQTSQTLRTSHLAAPKVLFNFGGTILLWCIFDWELLTFQSFFGGCKEKALF
jgi:hypothetical protein